MQTQPSFVFAGGGTGGHIYPALAVAEALRQQAPDCDIRFVCSTRPIDRWILTKTSFDAIPLPAEGLPRHPLGIARFIKTFHASIRKAHAILGECARPVVIGTGGFVTGPVCWAAHRRGVPIVLINVDSVAGKANKLAARWARDIFLQFDAASPTFVRHRATLHTVGCPLRQDFLHPDPSRAIAELALAPNKKVLLITGASSGAQHINEAVVALLDKLKPFAGNWQIVHLTGHGNYEQVAAAYGHCPLSHKIVPYYEAMAHLLACADLVIGRSGAVSVAEYAAAGLPAICIPYPFHKDRHQVLNAELLVAAGAAVMVNDDPDPTERSAHLWQVLEKLMGDPEKRQAMAVNARRVATPHAAARIAQSLLNFA